MADQTEGILSPYLRSKRLPTTLPYIKGRVLDVGCGIGPLAGYVSSNDYIGLDIDPESIELAKKRFPNHSFIQTEFVEERNFDTGIALAVIEHIDNYVAFLRRLKGYLKHSENAKIIGTTPHP